MKLSDRDLELMYQEMLDDCYGPVKILGYAYDCSRALLAVDPTAYRCGLADYIDSLSGESIFEGANGDYFDNEEEAEASKVGVS